MVPIQRMVLNKTQDLRRKTQEHFRFAILDFRLQSKIENLKSKIACVLCLVVTLLLPHMNVRAEVPEAEEVFQQLLRSRQTVDFEGKLTLISSIPGRDSILESLVIRKAPDKQRIEFTSPPEMSGTGMVINGEKRWPIRDKKDRRRRPFLLPPPNRMMDELPLKNFQLLVQNYGMQVFDGGHVAGRSTYLLEIKPKLPGRPSWKVWIDAEMGVILKMEHYDHRRKLDQVFAYSEINFEPEIDEELFRSRDVMEPRPKPQEERGGAELWNYNQGELDLDKIRKGAQFDVILPDQSPAGFILQSIHVVKFGERRNIHLIYTDGLSILSVFESLSGEERRGRERGERREDRPPWQRGEVGKMDINGVECEVMPRGPMLIFRWNCGGIYLTLMGELEQKEMAKIVSSFVKNG